jgi:hypothetical protein
MAKLMEIEKHVIDDALELIASIGVSNPLMHTPVVFGLSGNTQKVASFLRATLSRHVVLVVTRLHEPKGVGSTGETASIDSYLHYAELENALTDKQAKAFRLQQNVLIQKLEADGIPFAELKRFRNSELAHSLYCSPPLANQLQSLPIWDFAYNTFELTLKIKTDVSGIGNLDSAYNEWLDSACRFGREMPNPFLHMRRPCRAQRLPGATSPHDFIG